MLLFVFKCLMLLLSFTIVTDIEIDLKLVRIAKSFTNSKLYIDNDFFYTIPLFIGTEPQNFEVLYETNFTHLLINPKPKTMSHHFDSNLSTTFEQKSTVYSLYDFRGTEVDDVVLFAMNQFRAPWIYGYAAPDRYLFFDGVLGFGYQYRDDYKEDGAYGKRFSILEHLNSLNKNPKRLFGHKYFNDNKYLRLYIGEIKDEEFISNSNHPKCSSSLKPSDLRHKWTCLLKEITLSNGNRLNITGHVYFSTGSNLITGPNSTGIDLIDEIIKDQGTNCIKYYVSNIKISFRCSSTIDLHSFPQVTFKLNGVDLTLYPPNLVFKEYSVRGDGFIYKSRIELDCNEKYWSLGQPILRGHSMVFNEEDGSVGFWSLKFERNFNREIWVILGVSVILAGIFLVAILCNIKHHEKQFMKKGQLVNRQNQSLQEIDLPIKG